MLIYNSPQLIAVNRVLHRLLMPRHSPYALVRLNFLLLFSLNCLSFTLNMVIFTLREKTFACLLLNCFHLAISRFGEIVVITLDIGKTLNSIDLVNLMSSISVRFNSFLFSYSIFNEHKFVDTVDWSVWMDSNHRPHAYQACALTT